MHARTSPGSTGFRLGAQAKRWAPLAAIGVGALAASSVASTAPPPAPAASIAPITPPPSPFDDDAAMPKHAADVASYTLRATVDPKLHKLEGTGEIRWTNAASVATDELWLHLYLNAFKNERSVFLRGVEHGFRGSGMPTDWGWVRVKSLRVKEWGASVWPPPEATSPGDPDDETDVRVPLPKSVEPGESITLEIAWDEKLPSVLLRTGYAGSFHMFGQWFPKIARREADGTWAHFTFNHLTEFYSDFGHYDVTIDVPDGFVVGACGAMTEEKREKGRVTRRFVQGDVHDFAFTAWDKFAEKTDKTDDGVALRVLYPEGYDHDAEVELDSVKFGLARFGKLFGKYPYDHLTIVHPPEDASEAGGMEYPTLITTGGPWWMPETGVREVETVTIHELGHQWFYGLVATDEHRWPFLDEGVNSYAELEAMEVMYPGSSALRTLGLDVGTYAVYRAVNADVARNAAVAASTERFATGGDYGQLVYQRTSTILLTLARVYGEDAVERAVGRYTRKFRFEHPTPDDFVAAFRDALGDEVADTMHAALFDEATVDYAVDSFDVEEEVARRGIFGDPDKAAVDGAPPKPGAWRGQIIVRRRGALRFPVEIETTDAKGEKRRVVWDAKEGYARLPYEGDAELVRVVIDPDHRVLLDDDLSNNASSTRRRRFSPRVFEGTLFADEIGLSAVAP
jgi:hypothetical protein